MNKKSTLRSVANDYLTHPRQNSGITLVALVVTIVILLILAGVSINLVLGNNGIIEQAKKAKKDTNQKSAEEMTALDNLDKQSPIYQTLQLTPISELDCII